MKERGRERDKGREREKGRESEREREREREREAIYVCSQSFSVPIVMVVVALEASIKYCRQKQLDKPFNVSGGPQMNLTFKDPHCPLAFQMYSNFQRTFFPQISVLP